MNSSGLVKLLHVDSRAEIGKFGRVIIIVSVQVSFALVQRGFKQVFWHPSSRYLIMPEPVRGASVQTC